MSMQLTYICSGALLLKLHASCCSVRVPCINNRSSMQNKMIVLSYCNWDSFQENCPSHIIYGTVSSKITLLGYNYKNCTLH